MSGGTGARWVAVPGERAEQKLYPARFPFGQNHRIRLAKWMSGEVAVKPKSSSITPCRPNLASLGDLSGFYSALLRRMLLDSKHAARVWARRHRQRLLPSVSRCIGASLLSLVDASVVYAYAPDLSRGELDLLSAFGQLVERGVTVALPRIDGHRTLSFRVWSPTDELIADPRYGILEPASASPLAPPPVTIVLPGLAADPSGVRLGYGGGFYDRLLAHYTDALRVFPVASTCFSAELPSEPHDARVDLIVTERFCLWTSARELPPVQPRSPRAVPHVTPFRPAPPA